MASCSTQWCCHTQKLIPNFVHGFFFNVDLSYQSTMLLGSLVRVVTLHHPNSSLSSPFLDLAETSQTHTMSQMELAQWVWWGTLLKDRFSCTGWSDLANQKCFVAMEVPPYCCIFHASISSLCIKMNIPLCQVPWLLVAHDLMALPALKSAQTLLYSPDVCAARCWVAKSSRRVSQLGL